MYQEFIYQVLCELLNGIDFNKLIFISKAYYDNRFNYIFVFLHLPVLKILKHRNSYTIFPRFRKSVKLTFNWSVVVICD